VFPNLAVADDAIIRELPDGREPTARLALHEALLAAAEIAGASLRLIDMTKDYLLTRTQFGKPLGANQVLKHKRAEHHVRSQALIMMVHYAGAALDAAAPDADAAVRAAKYFAGTSGKDLAQDMLQLHGGIGYTMEYPLHLPMRRILRLTTSHGSTYRQGELLYRNYDRFRESA
jgi:alkylation response protein AidB-like acyl-CoA dehydrogenase